MENKYNLGITYKGKIIPNGIPYLKVKIEGIKIPKELKFYENGIDAILDTGAVNSHFAPSFAKLIGFKPIRKEFGNYIVSGGVSENNVYNVDFNINGINNNFKEEFKELPYEFIFPIIFGNEFLIKCKSLNIDFTNKVYTLEL